MQKTMHFLNANHKRENIKINPISNCVLKYQVPWNQFNDWGRSSIKIKLHNTTSKNKRGCKQIETSLVYFMGRLTSLK